MFVPTQSQEAAQQSETKTPSQPPETDSRHLDSAAFTLPSTESCSAAPQEEDSQATQIEDLEEPPGVDTSDSAVSRCAQRNQSDSVPSQSQSATSSKDSPKHRSECTEDQLPQKSDVPAKTSLNVKNVNVRDGEEASAADVVSCSQPKLDSSDPTVNSCVEETPPDATPRSLTSQSVISQTSAVDEVRSSVSRVGGETAEPSTQTSGTVSADHTVKDTMDECEQGEAEEEVMEEESTVGGGASGLALVLSQSELLSPEPMEEDGEDRDEDSVVVVTDSERDSQALQKDGKPQTNSSQPIRGSESVSTNGHESQVQTAKKAHLDSERAGPEPEGLKDKSLSDSSGGKPDSRVQSAAVPNVGVGTLQGVIILTFCLFILLLFFSYIHLFFDLLRP